LAKSTSSSLDGILPGLPLAREENERWLAKLSDPQLKRAFDLREEAWRTAYARSGDPSKAIELMKQAARLDPEYLEHVEGLENFLARRARTSKVSLPRAVNQKITPLLLSRGFVIRPMWEPEAPLSKTWRRNLDFCRMSGPIQQAISIGSGKFGHQLAVLVSIIGAPGGASHRDHRDFGLRHSDLEYLNQTELELVTARICDLLSTNVVPWLEREWPGV
jgi:hypothetical protein